MPPLVELVAAETTDDEISLFCIFSSLISWILKCNWD